MYTQDSTAEERALWTMQGRQAEAGAGLQGLSNRTFSSSSTSTMTLPQNIFTNPAIQPSSVINLSNSTDVVIGPMTQYQGPVSIYYMDASMQTAAGINSSSGAGSSSNSSTSSGVGGGGGSGGGSARRRPGNSKTKRFTRYSLLLGLLIISVVITVIVVMLEVTRGEMVRQPIYFGNTNEDSTFPNLGNGHLVIDRKQWGASKKIEPLNIALRHPVPYVLITHVGVQSIPCDNIYKCSIKMRTIQDSAIAEWGLPDIQSNFYVSDDGNIYVGRGWGYANTYANNSLAVTFLGDFTRYSPSAKQLEGVQFLLAHGVANRYIDLDYKLVAHNQTKITKSPGVYVYREVKKWPHFYACSMEHNPKCGGELGMTDASWDSKQ